MIFENINLDGTTCIKNSKILHKWHLGLNRK
jgi:hypothetical protein